MTIRRDDISSNACNTSAESKEPHVQDIVCYNQSLNNYFVLDSKGQLLYM
jgi:hypothetical protein